MPRSGANKPGHGRKTALSRPKPNRRGTHGPRYTVGLTTSVGSQVEQYAETADTSMSKAIAALVRLGLESQANRKREFFKKLRENLAGDDPKQQDRMVDEFRTLIL